MFTHHLTKRAGFGLSYIRGILTTKFDIFSNRIYYENASSKRVVVTNMDKYRNLSKMIALWVNIVLR